MYLSLSFIFEVIDGSLSCVFTCSVLFKVASHYRKLVIGASPTRIVEFEIIQL